MEASHLRAAKNESEMRVDRMAGLDKSVHCKLQNYVNRWFSAEQQAEKLVFDHVEVGELSQWRTLIFQNYGKYYCLQSVVDYTEYVNGVETCEKKHLTFHLPEIAVKALMMDYISSVESERDSLRLRLQDDSMDVNFVDSNLEEDYPAGADPAPAECEGCDAGS